MVHLCSMVPLRYKHVRCIAAFSPPGNLHIILQSSERRFKSLCHFFPLICLQEIRVRARKNGRSSSRSSGAAGVPLLSAAGAAPLLSSWLRRNGSFACDYQLCISMYILSPKYLDFLGAGSSLRVLCFYMFSFYLTILLMNKQKEGFTPA